MSKKKKKKKKKILGKQEEKLVGYLVIFSCQISRTIFIKPLGIIKKKSCLRTWMSCSVCLALSFAFQGIEETRQDTNKTK
jgi:hypothetical protein